MMSKKENIDKNICQALWGDTEVGKRSLHLTQQEGSYAFGVKKLSNYKAKSLAEVSFC